MAYSQDGPVIAFPAAADLRAKQYHAVKLDSNAQLAAVSAVGDVVLGVLQDDPKATEAGTVKTRDVTKMVAGAAITQGSKVYITSAGRATTTATNATQVGIALSSAAADGDIIAVLLRLA